MKYIDADLLKSKLKDVATEFKTGNYYLDNSEQAVGYENALIDFERFIDSLQQEQPSIPNLDEAAEKWCKENNKGIALCADGKSHYLAEGMDAFKAGAEWQKDQMLKDGNVILAEEDFDAEKEKSMELGYNLCKEQMMKEAVEGYVNYYEDSGGILMAEAQVGCPYHNGDRVRIIIVKEEK